MKDYPKRVHHVTKCDGCKKLVKEYGVDTKGNIHYYYCIDCFKELCEEKDGEIPDIQD